MVYRRLWHCAGESARDEIVLPVRRRRVGLMLSIVQLERGGDVTQVELARRQLAGRAAPQEVRNQDGSQDHQNRDDDQELDEGEPSLSPTVSHVCMHLSCPMPWQKAVYASASPLTLHHSTGCAVAGWAR